MPTRLRFDRWFLPRSAQARPQEQRAMGWGGSLHVKMGWAFTADLSVDVDHEQRRPTQVCATGVHFGFITLAGQRVT